MKVQWQVSNRMNWPAQLGIRLKGAENGAHRQTGGDLKPSSPAAGVIECRRFRKVKFALLRGDAKLKRLHHLAIFHPLHVLFIRVAQLLCPGSAPMAQN
jgi:hypothetical protein